MATFVALISETQEGEKNIGKSVQRALSFDDRAVEFGAKIIGQYWTMGSYDGVLVFESANEEAASALMLHLASKGSVRTQTMRAFSADEMKSILELTGA